MVWPGVLCQDQQSVTAASDLISLRSFQSRLVAFLPAKSTGIVLHAVASWQGQRWDSAPASFSSQLWRMSWVTCCKSHGFTAASWCTRQRFGFPSLPANAPKGHSAGQEDSWQWANAGLLAAADCSGTVVQNPDLQTNHCELASHSQKKNSTTESSSLRVPYGVGAGRLSLFHAGDMGTIQLDL